MPDAGEVKARFTADASGFLAAVEAVKSALAGLGGGGGGGGGDIGAAVSGAASAFEGMAEQGAKAGASLAELLDTAQRLPALADGMYANRDAASAFGTSIEELGSGVEETGQKLLKAAPAFTQIAQWAGDTALQLGPASEALGDFRSGLEQIRPGVTIEAIDTMSSSLHQLQENMGANIAQITKFAQSLEDAYGPITLTPPQLIPSTGIITEEQISAAREQISLLKDWNALASQPPSIAEQLGLSEGTVLQFSKAGNIIGWTAGEIHDAENTIASGADGASSSMGGLQERIEAAGKAAREAPATAFAPLMSQIQDTRKNVDALNDSFLETAFALDKGVVPVQGMIESVGATGIGGVFEGLMGGLDVVQRVLWPLQMIGQAIGTIGQGIYNAAVIAEGPAAHSFGSFTGQVDIAAQHGQKFFQQFSEGFGQQVLPALATFNDLTGGKQGTGFGLGGAVGGLLENLATGGIPIIPALQSLGIIQGPGAGGGPISGFNTGSNWSALLAATSTYPGGLGPNPISPNTPTPAMNWAAHIAATQTAPFPTDVFLGSTPEARRFPTYTGGYLPSVPGGPGIGEDFPGQNDNFLRPLRDFGVGAVGGIGSFVGGIGQGFRDFFSDFFKGLSAGPEGATGCFPAGTQITLANGGTRAIEDITLGERLIGGEREEVTVHHVFHLVSEHYYVLTFSDGNTLKLTDSHPISTTEGWKSLSPENTRKENPLLAVTTLQVGDLVHTRERETVILEDIRYVAGSIPVYNISVSGSHSYYADGVLVHNKIAAQAPDPSIWQQLGSTVNSAAQTGLHSVESFGSGIASFAGTAVQGGVKGIESFGSGIESFASTAVQSGVKGIQTVGADISSGLSQISLPHIDFSGITSSLASGLGSISIPHIDFSGITSSLSSGLGSISLPHLDFSGITSSLTSGIGGISLPHIDFSGITSSLTSGLGSIQIPHIDLSGIASGIASGIGSLQLPHVDFSGIASGLASDLSGLGTNIPLPHIDLSGVAEAIATALSQLSSIGASIPGFASGVEGFGGGLAVVGEGGPELMVLPGGTSIYPMSSGGGPIPLGLGTGAGGGMPQYINVVVQLDSQVLVSAMGQPLAQMIRLTTGRRS